MVWGWVGLSPLQCGHWAPRLGGHKRGNRAEAGTINHTFKCYSHRAAVLERCLKRLEWEKVRAKEAAEAADEAERERMAMMSVR